MSDKKIVSLTYSSSLSNLCEINSSFDTGVLRICYTGINRNGSSISKEDILKNMHTIYNCPVVCHYDRDTDTIGGHDMEVVSDDNGGMRLVNMTQPVGVIPESANTWFEEYTEDDGTIHEYLYADVLLWKRQEAYKKIKDNGITSHSMELTIKNGENVNGIYNIHDFEFTAFALIGVDPCFESSALELFSMSNFKEQYAQMMTELKESYNSVNTVITDDNIENFAKGGNEAMEQEIEKDIEAEVVEETEAAVAEPEESAAEFSAENGETEDVEADHEEVAEENESVRSDVSESEDAEFELGSNIEEELRRCVSCEKFTNRYGEEHNKYWFVDYDADSSMVYFESMESWMLYGCTYARNGDEIAVDFANAKRMKWVIAEFEEGSQDASAPMFSFVADKIDECYDASAKYHDASGEIESMKCELEELREFKAASEKTSSDAAKDCIFAKFEDLNGIEAFESLKECKDQYDVEILEEKCFAIRGRNVATTRFSAQDASPKIMVEKTMPDVKEPYGGIFMKYGARK